MDTTAHTMGTPLRPQLTVPQGLHKFDPPRRWVVLRLVHLQTQRVQTLHAFTVPLWDAAKDLGVVHEVNLERPVLEASARTSRQEFPCEACPLDAVLDP